MCIGIHSSSERTKPTMMMTMTTMMTRTMGQAKECMSKREREIDNNQMGANKTHNGYDDNDTD